MKLTFKNGLLSLVFLYGLLSATHVCAAAPPAFIENKGQILDQNHSANSDVLFMYCGKGLKIQLRKTGYSYELFNVDNAPAINSKNRNPEAFKNTLTKIHRVDIDFLNSNTDFEVIKENKQETVLNYFVDGKEVSNVNSFPGIIYHNIYDNTDIEFIINKDGSFKYNIVLKPGADINAVKFLCKGASEIRLSDGVLNFKTSLGDIKEEIPFSYYVSDIEKNIPVKFKLRGNVISFSSNHRNEETLVIDPSSNRIWGTYFGGSALEYCTSNGIDASNNVYIAGYSLSTANIATSGVHQSTLSGSFDAYLSKFNSNGVQQWGTYFGGSSFDIFYAIHVMPSGIVFATGDTGSTSNVASGGAHQTVYGGGIDDAILVKFDSNGQRLWSTYMGGTLHDIAQGVTVDSNGDVIITGHTESTGSISTAGAYATSYALNYDVFITKFNTNGVRQWGTYFGDTGADEAYGIVTDALNNIYFTGFTTSAFGISAGVSFQSMIGGGANDAFIVKMDGAGSNLIWGTYYGGTGDERGNAIKCDIGTGNIYIGGNTTSSTNIASGGAYQATIGSADDSFITAFTSVGNRLWGTYYGGSDVDYINSLVLDINKNILVGGQTLSTNAMSSANAYQTSIGSPSFYDAFFAKFSQSGIRKLGSYFGGPDNENGTGICIDNLGKIYLSGETSSTVSISTPGSHMPNYAGSSDAFLAKFCVAPEPTVTPASTSTTCVNNTYTLTASPGYTAYLWNTGSSANPLAVTAGSVAGTFYYTITVTDSDGCNGTSDSSTVIVNLCTGITEHDLAQEINIYPNPANEVVRVEGLEFSVESVLMIVDVLGKEVLRADFNSVNQSIDISELSAGIYFLKVNHNSKSYIKKIIVE